MAFARSNSVIHLELHTADMPGAVAFYGQLLGWRPERIRAGNGSYLTLGVGDRVGGGIVECETEHPLWVPHVVVPDVRATTDRAARLGSEVVRDPRAGPRGVRSVISAPDGEELGFFQPRG